MEIFLELLKYGVIQAILPSILAIAVIFVTKNHEAKEKNKSYILEKKREAFSNILSLIAETLISVRALYSWEEDKYFWIGEKDCDDFEMTTQKEKLYLSDDDIRVIQIIVETLRNNSSWQSNIMTWEESVGFGVKDISLIEYLYKILTDSFKKQLFDKQKAGKNISITFLEISCFFHNHIMSKKLVDKTRFSKFDYEENSISEVINNYRNNNAELHDLLEEVIKHYKKRTDNTASDIEEIKKLSDLLKEIR
jgi:hypothetical protein